jgi:outer membrane lipoprotein-sorting protein
MMPGRRAAIALLALATAGCASLRPAPPLLAGKDAGSARAIERELDERVRGLDTIRAGMDMIWTDPHRKDPDRCRGSLSFVAPDSIRLRGVSAAFFTVFDLVADGRTVWLDIPREDLLVFGAQADDAWERLPLSPRSLRIALLAHPCPGGECLDTAHVRPGAKGDSTLVLTGPFGELTVEAATGFPRRFVSADPEPFRIEWLEWSERSGIAWPQALRIEDADGQRLDVLFGRVQIGRAVPASRFAMEPDPSREILTPAEAATRWQEER